MSNPITRQNLPEPEARNPDGPAVKHRAIIKVDRRHSDFARRDFQKLVQQEKRKTK